MNRVLPFPLHCAASRPVLSLLLLLLAITLAFLLLPRPAPAASGPEILDISFSEGHSYSQYTQKYPGRPNHLTYRRGDTFNIELAMPELPDLLVLEIYGPAGYGWLYDTIICERGPEDIAYCSSAMGAIEFLSWTQFRVTLSRPAVTDVRIGKYKAVVHATSGLTGATTKDSLADFNKMFYVIFNPFHSSDDAYMESAAFRESFVYSQKTGPDAKEEYGIWYATGESRDSGGNLYTAGFQKTFTLRPYSDQIFQGAMNELDGHGLTSASAAYARLSEFVDRHLIDDPNAEQDDVTQLATAGTPAQCASHANFLVAHLRSVGITALPIYIDASKNLKNVWWFHTWVEAHVDDLWRATDPFKSANTPVLPVTLGTMGPAYNEEYNDLIGFGSFNWSPSDTGKRAYLAIFDGEDPEFCCGPYSVSATKIQSFAEASHTYWAGSPPQGPEMVTGTVGITVTTDLLLYSVGDTVAATVSLHNNSDVGLLAPVVVDLMGSDPETKATDELRVELLNDTQFLPPHSTTVINLDHTLDETWRGDYLYGIAVTADGATAQTPFQVQPDFELTADRPACLNVIQPFTIPVAVTNTGAETIENLLLAVEIPVGYTIDEPLPQLRPELAPGETWTANLTITADTAGLSNLTILVTTTNGGAQQLNLPLIINELPCGVYIPSILNQ